MEAAEREALAALEASGQPAETATVAEEGGEETAESGS
jgi:hypothetical protein